MSFVAASNSNPLAYALTRSLRFRSSASAYLNRTPATNSGSQIFTFRTLVKRGALGAAAQFIYFAGTNSPSGTLVTEISFTNDNLKIFSGVFGSTTDIDLITSQVFRDPASFYDVCVAIDTTQATASNRVKVYVNGSQITAFSTATYPSLNYTTAINNTYIQNIGRRQNDGYFDGYLTETIMVSGQALTPSSFGSTNATTGVWQPARYAGTYGTNGFYLDFEDTSSVSALGTDTSGNGNTWTVNNISVTAGVTYDSMTDVPTLTSATTANFCTLNPVYVSNIKSAPTLANANLTISASYDRFMNGTMSLPTTGKFYWEATVTAATTGGNQTALGVNTNQGDNRVQTPFVSTLNDVWGVAVNVDSSSISWYKNNVLQTTSSITFSLGEYFPFFYTDTNISPTQQWAVNFGQRPFSYTPPAGFVALNTFNLPDSTIVKGNKVMDATLYTGTGASLSVTNAASFKPDFVWLKSRSATTNHQIFDSVRGTTKVLVTNSTEAETTSANTITSFNSGGFTVGTNTAINTSAATYVGWQWQAGQGSSSNNTNGTITSTVSVNASAGFSVLTYTGTGATATVGHGLGVTPSMIVTFPRTTVTFGNHAVYHISLGNTKAVKLNLTSTPEIYSGWWNNTSPTSSVFSVGTFDEVNNVSTTYVAYCWAPIAGFSAFGSYTGNGSADGPFVYMGFRPKFVMVRRTDADGNWVVMDTSREPYNSADRAVLFPNLTNAEGTGATPNDILSNGFKPRNTGVATNASGGTFIYMAFAENPFKHSLAR